jgi:hypothetical protein
MVVHGRNLLCARGLIRWLALVAICGGFCWQTFPAAAAVAVISNRTPGEIKFSVVAAGLTEQPPSKSASQTVQVKQYKLAAGELTAVPLARGVSAKLVTDGIDCAIQADAAYYFAELPSGKIDLGQIGIGDMPADSRQPLPVPPKRTPEEEETARTITVKIFVDEKEPSTPAVWQRRLRDRVMAASDILERTCGMRLKIIGYGTWHSDDNITKFEEAVAEFTRKAEPGEARVAIGFTSQFQIPHGRTHLGGTVALLSHHILLREWSQYVTEPERLELLVHEVGHFMGAVHSPEPDSVMRAILGDKQARDRKFQIHYDPLNALAMNLVAEQWQQQPPLHSPGELSPLTRARLSVIYEAIAQSLPADPAALQYLRIMGRAVGPTSAIGAQ